MRKVKRIVVAAICLLTINCLAVMPVSAASKKNNLPAKITAYDYTDGEYVKANTVTLKYNKKGKLTKVLDKNSRVIGKVTYKTYKSGKIKAVTTEDRKSQMLESLNFDSKGRVKSYVNHRKYTVESYKTGKSYKKGRIDEFEDPYDKRHTHYLTYRYSNKKVNFAAERVKYNKEVTTKFDLYLNSSGFITESEANYSDYGRLSTVTYAKDSSGRIKTIYVKAQSEDGKMHKVGKYVLTYGSGKSNSKTLKAIVNTLAENTGYETLGLFSHSISGGYLVPSTMKYEFQNSYYSWNNWWDEEESDGEDE